MDELSQEFYGLVERSPKKTQALKEMLDILSMLGKLPRINQKMAYPDTLGEYDPRTNVVSLHPAFGLNRNTIPHEFSHAVDYILDDYIAGYGKNPTPEQINLRTARDKLNPGTSKLIPKNAQNTYRYTPTELRAFGVANAEAPDTFDGIFKLDQARPHMDATMATEAAILRDLFKRAIKTDGTQR